VVIRFRVPPDDLPRVRAVLAGELEPVEPRPASTVVLARDGAAGLEVLLLRRSATLAFAPGRHVFPGGSVEPSDAEEPPWVDARPAEASFVVAAVRETFEECGVLLAVDATGAPAVVDPVDPWGEADRTALESASVSLAAVLRRRGLAVDAAALAPLAHWVTPISERRRFDTRFLLAAHPEGQEARLIVGEADHLEWLRPAEAFSRQLPMLPPTRAMLRDLLEVPSVADALARARDRPICRIEPGVRLVGDSVELSFPDA